MFFHGTRTELPVGAQLTARPRPTNAFESLVEFYRPHEAFSRLSSFFLVDDPKEVELVGPAQRYIYEVVPLEKPTKVSFGWLEELPGCSYMTGKCNDVKVKQNWDKIQTRLLKYWRGVRANYGFEYLAPNITVKRFVGYGTMKE